MLRWQQPLAPPHRLEQSVPPPVEPTTIRATHALPVISANPDLNVLRRAHFAVELERNYFFQCRKDNDASACCSQAAACCKRHHVIGRKRPSSTKVNGRNWLCCLRGC
eukprot:14618-Heterococcus_DN1.PRE.2